MAPEYRLITCIHCKAGVREDRLPSHILRVHRIGVQNTQFLTQSTPQQNVVVEKELLTVPCSCGGQNENCFRCGGWGYIDAIGKGRAAPPSLMASKDSTVDRTKAKTRRGKPRNPNQSVKPIRICPFCETSIRNLQKHLKKAHPNEQIISDPTEKITSLGIQHLPLPSSGKNSKNPGRENHKEERKLDATHDYYAAYRDNGQYGSHPSHDGYDEESSP